MRTRTQSLLSYLRTPNPAVQGEACPPRPDPMTTIRHYSTPHGIREWEDFEYDTMNLFYGGELHKVLKKKFRLQDFSKIPEFPFCQYSNENSLDSLLIKWTQSVLCEALSKSQRSLGRICRPLFMVRGGQAESPWPEKKWLPDWGAVNISTV